MAGPITWRTVGGGGSSAASFLNMGQQQIQQGLSTLSGLVKENQKADEQNFQMVRDNNTEKYLDAVQSAGGIEALQNPEIRAQLEAQRAGFGAAIDRNATRNSIDTQVTGLQRAASVSNAYQDQTTERSQRGLIDNLYQLAASGDKAGAEKILNENQLFDEGNIRKNITGTFDAATSRQYAAEDQARQGRQESRSAESHVLSMQNMRESLANAREDRAYKGTERTYLRNAKTLDDAVAQVEGMVKANEASNIFSKVSGNAPKDTADALKEGMTANEFDAWWGTDKASRVAIQNTTQDLMQKGVRLTSGGEAIDVPIPPDLIKNYLASTKGTAYGLNPYSGSDSAAKDMRAYFDDYVNKNPEVAIQAREGAKMRKQASALVNTLKRKKTELSGTTSLDTSDIVKQLSEYAAGSKAPASQPAPSLIPDRNADAQAAQLDWPPQGGWSP